MNIFSFLFKNYTIIQNSILVGAKLLSMLSCIYFISKSQEYIIQWNVIPSIFPNFTLGINSFFSWFNTYILLIPLWVMGLSFLINDSIILRITSGFFGLIGTVVGLLKGLYTNTLGQVFNFKLFIVTHVASFEKKKEVFLSEFHRIADQLANASSAKLKFIEDYLSPTDMVIFDVKLNSLTSFEDVRNYANEVVLQASSKFDLLQKAARTPFNLTDYVTIKTVIITVVVVLVLSVGVMCIRAEIKGEDSFLRPLANSVLNQTKHAAADVEIQKDTISAVANNTNDMSMLATATQKLTHVVDDITKDLDVTKAACQSTALAQHACVTQHENVLIGFCHTLKFNNVPIPTNVPEAFTTYMNKIIL